MKRLQEAAAGGPVVLLVFGSFVAVHFGVTFTMHRVGTFTRVALAGVALAALLTGLGTLLWRLRGRQDAGAPFVLADVSLATALLGVGVAGMVVGVFAGPWLLLTSAGAALLALAGLVREFRARPR